MRRITIKTGGEKGQTLVEFALIVGFLVVLLFGITEFGRAWRYKNTLTNGARAGSRFASTLPNTTGFESSVKNYVMNRVVNTTHGGTGDLDVPKTDLFVNISAFTEDGTPITDFSALAKNDAVKVIVYYTNYEILSGSIIPVFSGTRSLTSSATMMYQ